MSGFAVPAAGLDVSILNVDMPSGKALLALAPLLALVVGLIAYCLVDLIRAPSVRYLPKPVWALIIVLCSVPVGAIAYLIFGRDRNGHDLAGPAGHDSDQRHAGSTAGR
jgi:ABC-2 type transport system ATP-binding protein